MGALPYWRLSGYYFFYFAFIGAFSPYFTLYLQALDFSAWDIGLLMSQMQLMRLLGPNLWGWIADHHGGRIFIIRLAGIAGLAGFMAFFWVDRLPQMLVAMAVLAFFWSAALPLVEALTFDHLREARGRYGRIRLWGSIGFIAAVMGGGALLDHLPPAAVLWVCAGILGGLFLNALLLPEATHDDVPAGPPGSISSLLRQPAVRALMLACFAMSAAHGGFYVFYSIHLSAHDYTRTGVGLLWSLGVVAEIVVFMLMPRLMAHFSLRQLLLASFWAAVVRFLIMGWGVESVLLMVVAQLLHGLTFGAYHAAAVAVVNRWFVGRARGRGQALYSSLSFGAGGLLGALISGWTWEPLGAGWVFTLGSVFALAGVGLIHATFRDPPAVDRENGAKNR